MWKILIAEHKALVGYKVVVAASHLIELVKPGWEVAGSITNRFHWLQVSMRC